MINHNKKMRKTIFWSAATLAVGSPFSTFCAPTSNPFTCEDFVGFVKNSEKTTKEDIADQLKKIFLKQENVNKCFENVSNFGEKFLSVYRKLSEEDQKKYWILSRFIKEFRLGTTDYLPILEQQETSLILDRLFEVLDADPLHPMISEDNRNLFLNSIKFLPGIDFRLRNYLRNSQQKPIHLLKYLKEFGSYTLPSLTKEFCHLVEKLSNEIKNSSLNDEKILKNFKDSFLNLLQYLVSMSPNLNEFQEVVRKLTDASLQYRDALYSNKKVPTEGDLKSSPNPAFFIKTTIDPFLDMIHHLFIQMNEAQTKDKPLPLPLNLQMFMKIKRIDNLITPGDSFKDTLSDLRNLFRKEKGKKANPQLCTLMPQFSKYLASVIHSDLIKGKKPAITRKLKAFFGKCIS